MTDTRTLTPASLALFVEIAEGHANEFPLVNLDGREHLKGNLTDLKKLGLVDTEKEEGCLWSFLTPAGIALAVEHVGDFYVPERFLMASEILAALETEA